MRSIILTLMAAALLIGCSSNPLEKTQWEGINGCEVQLLSLDLDTCCIYGVSKGLGKPFSIGMKYHYKNDILSFSPLKVQFKSQPTYRLDGEYLIDTKTNIPSFRKVSK